MEDELLDQTSLSLDPPFQLESPLPDRSPFRYEDECKVLEFPVRNFWKLAKTQNDIESLTEGHCNGFYYRLLLHPRGTAGTDSESNHLSVFLEAVVQDWYPEYWVFPNVRFELTVVNFKDPKQSVTSWAHWSFSSDATSRGWQKMISHSKLTKAAGFMDDEGTILVRGKAEPPYPRLWSRAPPYRPTKLWASIRIPSCDLPDKLDSILSEVSDQSQLDYSQSSIRDLSEDLSFSDGSCVNPWHKHEEDSVVMERILSAVEPLVPSIQPTLDSDVLALFVCILYNLKEFRKRILSFPYEEIFPKTESVQGEKNSDSTTSGSANIISALQDTFAYMYLYPIAVTCKARKSARPLGLSTEDFYMNEILRDLGLDRFESSLSSPFHFEPTLHVNCSALDCENCNYKNTLYTQGRDKVDPQLPNIKRLLLTLHMNDLQFLENSDPFTKIHTYIFTILLKDLANVRKILKQRRLGSVDGTNAYDKEGDNFTNDDDNSLSPEINNGVLPTPLYLHDQTELESTCKSLFSGSPESECLFRSSCDISSVYIRCKHIYSLQKALETSGHVFLKYPDVLFFYLQPNKNTKKGELFDVPLRLDATCLVPPTSPDKDNSMMRHDSSPDDDNSVKSYSTYNGSSDIDKDLRSSLYISDRQRSGSNRDDGLMVGSPMQYQEGEKWYSLYALVIKEGDRCGVNSYSLLLRPDEDGPWYRISEGRVERLETKMEFTEWKCHREFFCASAVYVAEDYIDLVQARDVDLSGDLKQWNPTLYYRTLEKLGVTEEEILSEKQFLDLKPPFLARFDSLDAISDYCHPRSKNVLIRKVIQGIPTPIPCKVHGFTKNTLVAQFYDKLVNSCVKLDIPQLVTMRLRRLALLQPLLVTTFKRSNQTNNTESVLLDRCLELEFITTLGEIFFSERANQLLFNGRSKCPHLDTGQYHLTPQGRLYGFHVTMLLIQPLRNLFGEMMEFFRIFNESDSSSNCGLIRLEALKNFCDSVTKCYGECLSLLRESGKKIRNTHYVIIDELRGVNSGGADFVAKHLGLSCDFLNPRYDLSVHKTNDVMAHLTSCYGLPSLFEMQCYLRHRGIYLHGLIRPHEIARMYIHFRPLLKGPRGSQMGGVGGSGNNMMGQGTMGSPTGIGPSGFDGTIQNPINSQYGMNATNTSQFDGMNSTNPIVGTSLNATSTTLNSTSTALNTTTSSSSVVPSGPSKPLNPFKFPGLQYPSLQVIWNEELFMGRPPERLERSEPTDAKSKYNRVLSNIVTKILVHLLPHGTEEDNIYDTTDKRLEDNNALVPEGGDNCTNGLHLITELDLADILPSTCTITTDSTNDKCTCINTSVPILPPPSESLPSSFAPFASFRVDQKTANSTYPTLFPPPLLNIDREEAASKNLSLNHFPFSLTQSLSDGLDPEFRRLLGERIISSPLFNDLLSIPDMQCGDLLSQVVSDVCAVQVGLLFPSDLFGCEGFYIEDKLFPSRRLTLNIELPGDRYDESKNFSDPFQRGYSMLARTEHLYWGVRKLLRKYLDEDVDQKSGDVNQGKKQKGKSSASLICPCGNNCFSNGDECQKLLKWRPTCSRDAFMLYALRCDIDPTRQGKRKFVYMHPDIEIASYIDPRKGKKMPGLVVLVAFAPQCLVQTPSIFPLADDSDYPLLIFKWMCTKSVDLLTVGAIVCDSKCHLQHYITEWLLPIVKGLGYLEGEHMGNEKDITRYMVLEECGVRTLQNVRRCSCAIKKINKRTGDVIIIQLKRQTDSPSSLKFKDKVALMNSIRQLEELEALELLPQSVAQEKLGEIDPTQYFTLDQVSVSGSYSVEMVDAGGKVKRVFRRNKGESPEREPFESTGSRVISRDGRSFVDFQTLPTTSEANLTADGNSVFAEDDQFIEDENKRLVGGKKKGKGRKKIVIPCNKKSTFNKQVTGVDEGDLDIEGDIDVQIVPPEPIVPPIVKVLEEFKQIVNITNDGTDYLHKGSQINVLRDSIEGETRAEFDSEVTKFFVGQADTCRGEELIKFAGIYAGLKVHDLDKFKKNMNTVLFLIHMVGTMMYNKGISIMYDKEGDNFTNDDDNSLSPEISTNGVINGVMTNGTNTLQNGAVYVHCRRFFDRIVGIADGISASQVGKQAVHILPHLVHITRLAIEGVVLKGELRRLATRLGVQVARLESCEVIDVDTDYIALSGIVEGWCIDFPHLAVMENPTITILAKYPIKVGEYDSNSREFIVGGVIHKIFIPITNEVSSADVDGIIDGISSDNNAIGVDTSYINGIIDTDDVYTNGIIGTYDLFTDIYFDCDRRDIRERRSLQAKLLRNLASLLLILQRKIAPIQSGSRRGKLIFNHAGELVGISLPNGVLVGPGRECNVRRHLVDASISHGSKSWRFLLIFACNEYNDYFTAEVKLKDLIIHVSDKFIETTRPKDRHVANPSLIIDECRNIIELTERRFCPTNNLTHHLPNMPISAAQDPPQFATLLLTRINGGHKTPEKVLYPLLPPNRDIPPIMCGTIGT